MQLHSKETACLYASQSMLVVYLQIFGQVIDDIMGEIDFIDKFIIKYIVVLTVG